MLQMLVHVDYTPNARFACYRWEYIEQIVIVNIEYHIVIFIVIDSVLQICIVSAEFISSHFC